MLTYRNTTALKGQITKILKSMDVDNASSLSANVVDKLLKNPRELTLEDSTIFRKVDFIRIFSYNLLASNLLDAMMAEKGKYRVDREARQVLNIHRDNMDRVVRTMRIIMGDMYYNDLQHHILSLDTALQADSVMHNFYKYSDKDRDLMELVSDTIADIWTDALNEDTGVLKSEYDKMSRAEKEEVTAPNKRKEFEKELIALCNKYR